MRRAAGGHDATAAAAALLAALALSIGALGVQMIPRGLPAWDAATGEWLHSSSQRAAFLVVLVVLVCAALIGAVPGRSTAPPAVALATSVAAAGWASLAPALWAVEPWARGAGLVLTSLLPAALLHLALAIRAEARATPALRLWGPLVTTAYLLLGTIALLHALSRDPFGDVGCLVRCESVDAVLGASWLARVSAVALTALAGLVALAVAGAAVAGSTAVDGAAARTTMGLLAVSAPLEVAWAWWPGSRAGVGPLAWDAPLVLGARAASLGLLGGWLAGVVLLRLRRRASLRRLAREITEVMPPVSMREVIATRLGDPSSRLDFFIDVDELWVDEEGRPSTSAPSSPAHHQTAVLRRGADVVARLTTNGRRARVGDLEDALGPAALLALEAARTRAEQLLRLRELRETRRRAVERSDLARRRAERDLHDGAQHLLLAASFALQEAMGLSRDAGALDRAERLAVVAANVSQAAQEVRQVAHGIYPVLLGDAGLVAALEGLALERTVAVHVDATAVPRVASSVELTAYLIAVAAVRVATAGPVRLAVSHCEDTLRLTVAGATLADVDAVPLADRAQALGGTLDNMNGTWRLELPCG